MNTSNLFKRKISDLEDLPDKPEIFFYVSAGSDFRGLTFLTDFHIQHEIKHHKRYFKKPDLFVFNCLGRETNELIRKVSSGNRILYKDSETEIKVIKHQKLELQEEVQNTLSINPELIANSKAYQRRRNTQVHFMKIDVTGKNFDETHLLLYFEHENIDFFNQIILKDYFKVQYLCATREGCGMGGCNKSIVEYIYKDNEPGFFFNNGFAPEFCILFNDFTHRLFESQINKVDFVSYKKDYGNSKYIREDQIRKNQDATIYKMKYSLE